MHALLQTAPRRECWHSRAVFTFCSRTIPLWLQQWDLASPPSGRDFSSVPLGEIQKRGMLQVHSHMHGPELTAKLKEMDRKIFHQLATKGLALRTLFNLRALIILLLRLYLFIGRFSAFLLLLYTNHKLLFFSLDKFQRHSMPPASLMKLGRPGFHLQSQCFSFPGSHSGLRTGWGLGEKALKQLDAEWSHLGY